MSHFLLGIFVMYPDLVMQMDNAVITTSNTWSGTKILMNVRFDATKMFGLTDAEWVPLLHTLEDKCNKLAREKRNKPLFQDCRDSSAPITSFTSSSCDPSTEIPVRGAECRQDQETPTGGVHDDGTTERKRKHSLDSLGDTSPSVSTDAATSLEGGQLPVDEIHISEEYVRALCAQATLLLHPVRVHMVGTITMFLDADKHIEHMSMIVNQN